MIVAAQVVLLGLCAAGLVWRWRRAWAFRRALWAAGAALLGVGVVWGLREVARSVPPDEAVKWLAAAVAGAGIVCSVVVYLKAPLPGVAERVAEQALVIQSSAMESAVARLAESEAEVRRELDALREQVKRS